MTVYLEYARDLPYTGGELIYVMFSLPKDGHPANASQLDEVFPWRLLAYTLYAFYFVFVYVTSTNSMQFAQQTMIAAASEHTLSSTADQRVLRFIAVAITTAVCLLLYFSSAQSRFVNQVTAGLKVIFLVAVICFGIVYAAKTLSTDKSALHDWGGNGGKADNWTQGFLTVLFSYHGWENATLVSALSITTPRQF